MSARGEFTNVMAASESGDTMDLDSEEDKSESTEPKEERDNLINPYWIEDRDLGRGEVDHLSGVEIQFWKDLIDKYLHPIDADKQREVSVQFPKSRQACFNLTIFQLFVYIFLPFFIGTNQRRFDRTEKQGRFLLQCFQCSFCSHCVHVDPSQGYFAH